MRRTTGIYKIRKLPDIALRNRMLSWLCAVRPQFCQPLMGNSYRVTLAGRKVLIHAFEPFPHWFMEAVAIEAGCDPREYLWAGQNHLMKRYLTRIAKSDDTTTTTRP